jgi:hypothetical protein
MKTPTPVECGLIAILHDLQGQEWTTIEGLVEEGHHNKFQEIEPGEGDRISVLEDSFRGVMPIDGGLM